MPCSSQHYGLVSAQDSGHSFFTRPPRNGSTGTITDGNLDYAVGEDLDRIMKVTGSNSTMRFNDFSASNTLQAVFQQFVSDGMALDWQVEVDLPAQSLMVEVSSGTGGWVNFTVDADFYDTVVDLIAAGDSVKVAIAPPGYVFP